MKKKIFGLTFVLILFFHANTNVFASDKTDEIVNKCISQEIKEIEDKLSSYGLLNNAPVINEIQKTIYILDFSVLDGNISSCIVNSGKVNKDGYISCASSEPIEFIECTNSQLSPLEKFNNCMPKIWEDMQYCASQNEIKNDSNSVSTNTNSNNNSNSVSTNTNSNNNSKDVELYSVVTCGNNLELPEDLVKLISIVIAVIQIAVPLILIVMGMLDFAKAASASKEEDMKKAQQSFVRRLIAGVCVFLVISVVKIAVGIVNTDDSNDMLKCVNKLLNGETSTEKESENNKANGN